VQRNHRKLRGKPEKEPEHDPEPGTASQRRCEQLGVAEREHAAGAIVREYQRQNRHQHDETRRLREDEELDRRVEAWAAAGNVVTPERDQEEHRHQHDFPEQEEQEQVRRKEHADDAGEVP